ncbi:sodium/proton antiporter, CPA1 family [Haladaptatus litoreus]|uniref:Sodium/proton antiporter, CPA1 family n=1 Tax=Haladaptatus litoreus TaxID=553468 RepID=A0A1N6Y9F0_9EURY|nr:cation:proton antiporter [Haladaptatus litoreus]SIR11207.1 sodium/proton antiporter, CPA1 family [Haladaptatus litoreus]
MVETYVVALAFLGLLILAATVLPELLGEYAVSVPISYLVIGAVAFLLPVGLPNPDPLVHSDLAERLAEFVVIVSLMSAGLKIDRPFSLGEWSSTWRLLVITMPLTIAGAAIAGWWVLGFVPATAMLLGAVIAPTDPVLASDVQVGPPGEGENAMSDQPVEQEHEHEVRFTLTSEAGLNDGLAFPFTYVAIAIATAGLAPSEWFVDWLLVDVIYKIVVGTVAGLILGWLLAGLLFQFSPSTKLASTVEGAEALAGTLLVYGITELVQGYGFIAVFAAALVIRHRERTHEYNRALHDFAEVIERLTMAVLLALFGGAVATGLLENLTFSTIALGLGFVFVLRPLAGLLGMAGSKMEFADRSVISFFGIRGVGSFFYLAYAINEATFPDARLVWSLVGFVVLVSVIVHGTLATPVMEELSRRGRA